MKEPLYIVGPTAAGKTEYALELARRLDGEILSADSMQIYLYMDIGSAKPSARQLETVPHHLVGRVDPRSPFSAADYRLLAQASLKEIAQRGKLAIVCGGTSLYIHSLLFDLDFSSPPGSQERRQEIFQQAGGDKKQLHDQLRQLDARAAASIHPNNVKRVLRAIERIQTGEGEGWRPFEAAQPDQPGRRPLVFGIYRNRDALDVRIRARVSRMWEAGLSREVAALLDLGLKPGDTAMQGIGYKEVLPYLEGRQTAEESRQAIALHTRRYAKRQLSWLRRYDFVRWFHLTADGLEEPVMDEMLSLIEERRGENEENPHHQQDR